MTDVKSIAGGLVIAGSLGLAAFGVGAGVANAAPSAVGPEQTSVQNAGQTDAQAPGLIPPSPYAAYGGAGICGTPGMYFVNICS